MNKNNFRKFSLGFFVGHKIITSKDCISMVPLCFLSTLQKDSWKMGNMLCLVYFLLHSSYFSRLQSFSSINVKKKKKKKARVLWGKETFLELNIHPAITDASSCPCHLMERACYVARLNGWKRAKMSQRTCLFGIETEHKVGWISAAFKNPRHFAWLV